MVSSYASAAIRLHDMDEVDRVMRGFRVLHVTDSFLPNAGGLEQAVATLVRTQFEHGRVTAVATAPHPEAPSTEDMDGVPVFRLPMTLAKVPGAHAVPGRHFFPPLPDPQVSRALSRRLRRYRPDIVHVHGWALYSVLGPAGRAGVPVVATAHDYGQVCATKTMRHLGAAPCDGPGLARCVRCALRHYGPKGVPFAAGLYQIASGRHREVDRWMAISTSVAAAGSAPRERDRGPVTVLPTFLDDSLRTLASWRQAESRPEFAPASGPYLFYAGALSGHKGVDVLLDAHARLWAEGFEAAEAPGRKVPLVLAGLPQHGFRLPERDGVVLAQRVPHEQVLAAWRHATIGVVPSVWAEPLGRVAVECLAAGTPCVVSATGGLVDVVEDGVQGVHVPPGNPVALAAALRRLLADPALRARLGAAGPAKAADFTLSAVLPQLCTLYLQVLAERGAPWPGPVD